MDDPNRAKIQDIKSKIIAMLEERHLLENYASGKPLDGNQTSMVEPSKYWSDFCSYFDYMLGLSEESFAKIRLHTYHLTGDNYQRYYFGDPKSFLNTSELEVINKDLPSNFIINEPEGGIGFHYDNNRFISLDIIRYQHVLSTCYRYNVLPELTDVGEKRRYVLEIGGGYGGLAHHFSKIYEKVTYILVDIPETLLFSASYLSLLNSQKKIYVYEKKGFQESLQPGVLDNYDFILLPNYVIDSLSHLRFDLAINQASFQEMRTGQVEKYLDFINKTCKGVLYSWNQDHQPRNNELSNLSELLRQRFDLFEIFRQTADISKTEPRKSFKGKVAELLRPFVIYMGLLEKSQKPASTPTELPYREYICRPLTHHNRIAQVE